MRPIQQRVFLGSMLLVVLAVGLSSGLSNARTLRVESSLASATAVTVATLSAPDHLLVWNAGGNSLNLTPPKPPEPPDPCTIGQLVKRLLASVASLL